MFKLPSKVRIGQSNYSVSIESLTDDLGKCDGDKNYIKLGDDLTDTKRATVFLHETLHAILHEYHVDLPTKTEERVVLAMESGLCGFAKDNQKLFQQMIKVMGETE